jgi:O-antigen ligase
MLERIIFYSLCGAAFSMPLGMAPMNFFIVASIFFWIVKIALKKNYPPSLFQYKEKVLLSLFLLFSLSLLISCVVSSYKLISLRGLVKYVKYFTLIIVAVDVLDSFEKWRKVLGFLFFALGVVSIDAIYQYLTGYDIFIREKLPVWLGDIKRATATFHHPNDLGLFLVGVIPLFFINSFYLANNIKGKIFKILFLVISVLALILTFSRGAALGLLISMFIISICLKNFLILLSMLVTTVLSPLILPSGVLRWTKSVDSLLVFMFNEDRLWMFKAALNMIKQHPFFGIGLNTFYKNYSLYKLPCDSLFTSSAHNAFLHLGAEIGLIGFFIFSLLMIYIMIRLWKSYRTNKLTNKNISLYSLGLFSSLLSFLTNCITESGLQYSRIATFFWFMVALALVFLNISKKEKADSPQS